MKGWARAAVVLVLAGCGDDAATEFSPALAVALDEEVRLIDLHGESRSWASVRAWRVAWSSDGRRLAYITPAERGILYIDDVDSQARLFEVRSDWMTSFAWAPDGRRLAFRTGDYQAGGISVVDVETGAVRVVSPPSGDDVLPVWSPDGRRLLFQRQTSENPSLFDRSRIMVADLESGAVVRLTATDALETENDAVFSADGRWIGFLGGPPFALRLYGPAGERLQLGAGARFGARFSVDIEARYMLPRPGSSAFLYAPYGEGDSARMVLFDPDREVEVEIDRTGWRHGWWEQAVWSPDGRFVAHSYHSDDGEEPGERVRIRDVDRGEVQADVAIPADGDVAAIRWSRDGQRIVVLARDQFPQVEQSDPRWGTTGSVVCAIDVATGELKVLHVEPKVPSWDMAWRP